MIRLFPLGSLTVDNDNVLAIEETIVLGCPFKVDAVAQKMLALKFEVIYEVRKKI